MEGNILVEFLKNFVGAKNDTALAEVLSVTQPSISQLRKNRAVGEKQAENFLNRVITYKINTQIANSIHPIVEFFPISSQPKKTGNNWVPFDAETHPQLKKLLLEEIGLYSFYNSEGKNIYFGKTKKNLYDELLQTFNRKITKYKMYRTMHTKQSFSGNCKLPNIEAHVAYLFDSAKYFSCYRVEKDLVDTLEASIIRIIPNNIINRKIEKIELYNNKSESAHKNG